jgi:hypothetical protein
MWNNLRTFYFNELIPELRALIQKLLISQALSRLIDYFNQNICCTKVLFNRHKTKKLKITLPLKKCIQNAQLVSEVTIAT